MDSIGFYKAQILQIARFDLLTQLNLNMIDQQITLPETGFVRLPLILKLFPIGRSTWWQGVKDGKYPKPVKLGERTTAWRVKDIKALIDQYSSN